MSTPRFPKLGPLCEGVEQEVEEYRFTWRSSFHGSAIVHIGRGGNSLLIDWVRHDLANFGRYRRYTEATTWPRLEAALLAASFWSLDSVGDENLIGLDGTDWLIEGRRRDVYRAVRRWSPGGSIYDLGQAFLEVAGPPIVDIELY